MEDHAFIARHFSISLAVTLLMAFVESAVYAQQPTDARVLLTAGGPTAAIRAIAFSADSRQLYLAGADKSVEIWSLPEFPQNALDLHLVNHARWPVARHGRGQIWALAVNHAQGQLAFAGYAAQNIMGDISITDSIAGHQLTVLPPVRPGEDPQKPAALAHQSPVSSLSFSLNCEWLVSMSVDGELRLWSVGAWNHQTILNAGQNPGLDDVFVQFISNNQFVASLKPSEDQQRSKLLMFSIGVDRKVNQQVLECPHETRITALASDPESKHWFSGDDRGNIGIWKGTRNVRIKSPYQRLPVRSISASQNNLLMALHSPRAVDFAAGNTQVAHAYVELDLLVDDDLKSLERREWKLDGETHAAAISRDGALVAIARPGDAAVEVFSLLDNGNQQRQKPFSEKSPTVLTGNGATVHRVQFAKAPATLLAISAKADGTWTHGFNLATAEVIRPNDMDVVQGVSESAEWKIQPVDPNQGKIQRILIAHQNGSKATISLDLNKHGDYAAHCWIRENGKVSPSAVAIGTSRQNGVFLYDLRPGALGRLLRYYRDHTNSVISLSQSADGRYLATSSRDQTVRIWSLAGLFEPAGRFPQRAAWGGDLEIRNGQLIVKSLMESGILVSRGMEDGDQIVRVEYLDSVQKKSVQQTDPSQILKAMEQLDLTKPVKFWVRHNKEDRAPFMITPAWEPMVTLFIDQRQEWVAWTSQGYYNASVSGDELIGFQLNGPNRGDPPKFYPAEQLREKLERPDLLKGLFATGSFAQAAKAQNFRGERVDNLVATIPSSEIISPRPRQVFSAGEPVKLVARLAYSADQNPAKYETEASVGGLRLELTKQGTIPSKNQQLREYEWEIPQVAGGHLAVVRVKVSSDGADGDLYGEQTVPFEIKGASDEPRLRQVHILAIGAENYAGELKIPYCNNDAKDFLELLRTKKGPFYEIGVTDLITDDIDTKTAKFERTSFLGRLNTFRDKVLQSNLRGGDLVVVYISGHGCTVGTESKYEYYFVPPVSQIRNLNRSLSVIQQNAIPWSAFRDFIDQFHCDRIVFIDTCFSGNVTQLEADKATLRPLKKVNTLVFAATSLDMLAKPDHASKHGLFTEYVLKALQGGADGASANPPIAGEPVSEPDGKVTLQEMIHYVTQGVENHYMYQTPRFTPIRQLPFLNDPFTKN